MKAIILKGKNKGKIVTISQWCNDWFSIRENNTVYSPTMLGFTHDDFLTIIEHKNNGIMFRIYEPKSISVGKYEFTFKKRK